MAQFLDGLDLQGWTLNIPRYVLPPLEEDIPPLSEAIEALKTALNRCREAEARHERGRVVDPASVVYSMDVRLKQESVHHANRAYFY
jgi:hypothetical protein